MVGLAVLVPPLLRRPASSTYGVLGHMPSSGEAEEGGIES